jgi:hypothetical protein
MHSSLYEFPWREIDDRYIETEGFLKEQFVFTIDQEKILNLLTGHTLYNDSGVVLREAVQNSLDAVRLQHGASSSTYGRIEIEWDETERVLMVRDNGTGMTQEIIENNLLKVGSSRYQDDQFVEDHPDFSPISRFGIGVLSAFMVADAVEIVTSHPEEAQARQLTLRSVHGKYLIRLLDKDSGQIPKLLREHGTEVKLRLRPSAEVEDIDKVARSWVVLPKCHVTVSRNGEEPRPIGFSSLEDALRNAMEEDDYLEHDGRDRYGSDIKIITKTNKGVTLAFAVRWSELFREWTFVQCPEATHRFPSLLGSCVEGVRVEATTPGYRHRSVYALANAAGRNAPKTNVARSGFESGELSNLLHSVYASYLEHVTDEVNELQTGRGYSLTWAAREGSHLLDPLVREARSLVAPEVFEEELTRIKMTVLEDQAGRRQLVSLEELATIHSFWTLESTLLRHAEEFIKEIGSGASLRLLLENAEADIQLPKGPLVRPEHSHPVVRELLDRTRGIRTMKAAKTLRRLDVEWVVTSEPPVWRSALPRNEDLPEWARAFLLSTDTERRLRGLGSSRILLVPVGVVETDGFTDEVAASIGRHLCLLPGTKICHLIAARWNTDPSPREIGTSLATALVANVGLDSHSASEVTDLISEHLEPVARTHGMSDDIETGNITSAFVEEGTRIFSARAWDRQVLNLDQ